MNSIAPRIPPGRSAFSRSVGWRLGWPEGRLVDGSVDGFILPVTWPHPYITTMTAAGKVSAFSLSKAAMQSDLAKKLFGVPGNIPIIVDYSAASMSDFVCGANEDDKHFVGVNWGRDTKKIIASDLRIVVSGDPSPDGKGNLEIKRGIEVGHIFQLGTKYSDSMNANVIGEDGRSVNMNMGCYGIGVTRIIAASIEQNHDDRGIIFPEAIAPFQLVIVPINYNKSSRVKALADQLYMDCLEQNIEVLLDDRKERPGIMFADSELIGIPHRLVISDTHADNGKIEYKSRKMPDKVEVDFNEVVSYILDKLD